MTETPETRATPAIERFALGGALLSYATSGLTPEQIHAHPGPGTWSIAQLAAHLLDSDLVLADRMKRVLAEDDPPLMAFDETAWVARLGYEECSVVEAVSLLTGNRRWMAALLRRCTDADFGRAGRHSEAGRVTLAGLLAAATNHLDHHLRFLYAKRANLGVALPPRYASEALGEPFKTG